MNVSEAIRTRHSVRKYQPGVTIPQEHIRQILEAAMHAPSAVNSRPWEFVVVENPALRQQISATHPYCRSLPDASLAIVVCGLPDAWPDAPQGGMWPQDCAAATENILLEATGLGYGTCWCGVYPHRERAEAIARLIGVASVPVSLIIVGKAAETPKARGFYDESRVTYLR